MSMEEERHLTGNRYEILLQNVLAENRRLRETIEARDSEQKRLFEELSAKLEEQTTSGPGKGSRQRKRKISVSKQCRQDFRKMYNTLKMNESFEGFALSESISTQANRDVTKIVIDAVVADNGGNERCPWSHTEMKSAAATYLKSLINASKRVRSGRQEAHKALCRRQGRIRDKVQRRRSTIELMPWSESKKATIYKAMTVEYTSSDESNLSEDENGVMQLKGYRVKKLPWERSSLTTVKKSLDEAYLKTLRPRLRANILERRPHARPSTRGIPVDPLDWAVRPAAIETPTMRPPTGRALGTPTSVPALSPCTSTPLRVVASPTSIPTPDITQESTSPLAVTLPTSTRRLAPIMPTVPMEADLPDREHAAMPLHPARHSLVNPTCTPRLSTGTQDRHRKNSASKKRSKTTTRRQLCA